jgi:hypothetical protein
MARKKYIPQTRVSENIYERYYGVDKKGYESVSISVEYIWNRPYAVDLVHYSSCIGNKNSDDDWEWEQGIHIREEAVQKLANKLNAKDAKTLLNQMADRFRSYEMMLIRRLKIG